MLIPNDLLSIIALQPGLRFAGPNQISAHEAKLLSWMGEQVFTGAGVCIDAGCGSGGSSRAICEGLARNRHIIRPKGQLHCFDRFVFDHESYRSFLVPRLPTPDIGGSFLHHFLENIGPHIEIVSVHDGDLHQQVWDDTPVEILFIDIAKTMALHQTATALFFRSLIPGKSFIIHQDFERPNLHWIHTSIGYLMDECPIAGEIVGSSLILRVDNVIPTEKIDRLVRDDFTLDERLGFLDRVLREVKPTRSDVAFDPAENYRLTRAFLHAHHGDCYSAALIAKECRDRDYFRAHKAYEWMLSAVARPA